MQVGFKRELIKEVRAFVGDAQVFRREWEQQGPMVPGLDPMEAVDRLRKFQQTFDVKKRKWENYASGEELFGLPITLYPELEQTEKEIQVRSCGYSSKRPPAPWVKGGRGGGRLSAQAGTRGGSTVVVCIWVSMCL